MQKRDELRGRNNRYFVSSKEYPQGAPSLFLFLSLALAACGGGGAAVEGDTAAQEETPTAGGNEEDSGNQQAGGSSEGGLEKPTTGDIADTVAEQEEVPMAGDIEDTAAKQEETPTAGDIEDTAAKQEETPADDKGASEPPIERSYYPLSASVVPQIADGPYTHRVALNMSRTRNSIAPDMLDPEYIKSSFHFIGAEGQPITDKASAQCILHPESGLMWELKEPYNSSSSLQSSKARFSWGGDDTACTASEAVCNSDNYISYINNKGLCGASDWRLPNVYELLDLADLQDNFPRELLKGLPTSPEERQGMAVCMPFWSASTNFEQSQAMAVFFDDMCTEAEALSDSKSSRLRDIAGHRLGVFGGYFRALESATRAHLRLVRTIEEPQ